MKMLSEKRSRNTIFIDSFRSEVESKNAYMRQIKALSKLKKKINVDLRTTQRTEQKTEKQGYAMQCDINN